MSRYQFDITYVKGELNKVADCLSRYFESDVAGEAHEPHEYVQADCRIDPDGEDLPLHRYQELREHVLEVRAMRDDERRRSTRLREQREEQDIATQLLKEHEVMDSASPGEHEHPNRLIMLAEMLEGKLPSSQPPSLGSDDF